MQFRPSRVVVCCSLIAVCLTAAAGVVCYSLEKHPPATQASLEQHESRAVVSTERLQNLSADKLYAKASPAVVCVVVRNRDFRVTGLGSGFVVTPDGLIVTNYHVVADAYFADVQFPNGSHYLVEGLIGLDSDADLALLKINATKLPTLEIAKEVLPPIGMPVFAIGNPQGLTNTLSEGLVSGHRTTESGLSQLQTTAAISPGSSGGPLLNSAAQVIGVTTQYLEGGQNLNFVVPAARVSRLLQQRGTIKTLASSNVGRLTKTDASTLEQVWRAIESANYRRALTLLGVLRAEQGNSLYYWAAVGRVHLELGNNELAVEAYKTALQIAPHEPTIESAIYFNLGLACARSGRSEEAVSAYCSAVDLDPNNPKILYALGLQLITMERMPEAIFVLRLANQFVSDQAEKAKILTSLGMAYVLAQQPVEASKALEAAVSNGARDAETYYCLGLSYKCLRRYPEAEAMFRLVLDVDPNHNDARRALIEVSARFERPRDTTTPPVSGGTYWKITHSTHQNQQRIIYHNPNYQKAKQSQKQKHERLMEQTRKRRAAEDERWRKEYQDSLTASARIKAARKKAEEDALKRPGVIIGPVIGPYNNPFVNIPPHITVKILSAKNKK